MLKNDDLAMIIEENQKKIKELEIRKEALDEREDELLIELNVRPEQLTAFISDPSQFTEKNWKELQDAKVKLDKKLKTELDNIRDPNKVKRTYKERNIGKHWIYIR